MAVLTKVGSFQRPLPSYAYGSTPVSNAGASFLPQIGTDASGNIFVASQGVNDILTKFNSAGSILGSVTLADISGVATDSSGNVYLVHGTKHSKYTNTLVKVRTLTLSPSLPLRHVAADDSTFYFVTVGDGRVFRFDQATGSSLSIIINNGTGSGNGQFAAAGPAGIAYGGGYLYVVDPGNSRIQKFNTSGVFQDTWGSAGSGDGQFSNPDQVAVDPVTGLVFVTDRGNTRVQAFLP